MFKLYEGKELSFLEDFILSISSKILKEDLVDTLVKKINNPYINSMYKLNTKAIPTKSLKQNLGLDKFKHIYIQRFQNIPFPIFLITVDSRYPSRTIPTSKAKKSLTTQFLRTTSTKDSIISMMPKLTPLKPLDHYSKTNLPAGALIIIRDLGGEDFIKKKMHL
jgi:hypothetical protein